MPSLPATEDSARPTIIRHWVVASTALMSVLLYLDRFCISFAEIFIKEDLRLTDLQIGMMLSAFFWTYALSQVPSGWLTDRFGGRIMLTTYILLWSLFTALTGLASGLLILLLLRFGFGVGQAGAYPSSGSLLSKWAPFANRGTASSIVSFGGRVGGAIAPLLTGVLIVMFVGTHVSSQLKPDDLLDVGRLCYELSYGSDVRQTPPENDRNNTAARVGFLVVGRFSPAGRQVVNTISSQYSKALQKKRKASAARAGGDLHPAADALSPEPAQVQILLDDLNRVLRQPDLYDKKAFAGATPEREAKRLLNTAAPLSTAQTERLNRLLLESAYRKSIKKIYGAGWRPVLLAYGLVGVLVAGLFWFVFRDEPSVHPGCNAAEVELIEYGRPASAAPREKAGRAPLVGLVRSRSMWLSCLSQFMTNIGWVFLVTWLPRYLDDVHKIPVEQRALMTFIPVAVGMAGMLFGGILTDRLTRRFGLRWGRALPMSASRFLAMAAYLFCLTEPSPWAAVAAFSVVALATDLGVAATWGFMQDVGGKNVGAVLGWGNMWGNLGAAIAPLLVIWIVTGSREFLPSFLEWTVATGQASNWTLAFLACAMSFLVAGIAAAGIDATVPISDGAEA